MIVLRTLAELEAETRRRGLARGLGGVLVPTMGALHEGHGVLVRRGASAAAERGLAGGCVVSIFVNPTQFNEAPDFQRYPRMLDADLAVCEAAGAACVFAPGPEAVYPPGERVAAPPLPRVAVEPKLEDAFRPGHFAGVCQVVHRLFLLLGPRAAVFGEKDWQQYRVVSEMAGGSGLEAEIIPHPTQRDADGLAMSSRNRFLSARERRAALAIPRALRAAAECVEASEAERVMGAELSRAGLRVEYAVVRDAETLLDYRPGRPGRALIAARAGQTRLIDNAPWPA